ncbi:MAG: ATP-dependent helicase [Patescibacteria group bacterium]|nr:ATP-dependent helicase [Patescibacteria group bacterium]
MKQDQAFELLTMGHNVFLTGPAGAGKTYLINRYRKWLDQKSIPVALTASTGIAATHIGGVTIHSWSGLGVKDGLSVYDLESLLEKKYLSDRVRGASVLILDEISMLSSRQFSALDDICRAFRAVDLPFGGLQLVLSGDFFQLPPIQSGYRQPNFAFESESWKNGRIKSCYLEEQFRQGGDGLSQVLADIRGGNVNTETKKILLSRLNKKPTGDIPPARLFTHNADVDAINNNELVKLPGPTKVYEMTGRGAKKLRETLARTILAPERLALKPDARVMFVRNNFEAGFVNGTMGIVVSFDRTGWPIVRLSDGKKITVAPETWRIEDDGKVKAEVSQLPLRLAWAITIHKSQGMSLDALEVDLSKAFVPGMGYVALSRARRLDGLNLLGINDLALQVEERISYAETKIKDMSSRFVLGLNNMTKDQKDKLVEKFITESKKEAPAKKLSTYAETKVLVEEGLVLADIAKQRGVTEETIISHLEKLREEIPDLEIDHFKPATNRFAKILEASQKCKSTKLSDIKKSLPASFSFKEIRLARLFFTK